MQQAEFMHILWENIALYKVRMELGEVAWKFKIMSRNTEYQ